MKQLPQNLKAMLQEIGERTALLYLHLLIAEENLDGWRAYPNHLEAGCDIVLLGPARQLKIEVKTRQTLLVESQPNVAQFTISALERESCDFVLAYWFNRTTFFVVPASALQRVSSNGQPVYKFTARYSERDDDFTDGCRRYAGDWQRITDSILELM